MRLPCYLPYAIASDENFTITDNHGTPVVSCYRRDGGKLELIFESLENGDTPDRVDRRVLRSKLKSLNEGPAPVEMSFGMNGLQFTRRAK